MYNVLILNGVGTKSIATIKMLEELEERSKKNITELFDYVAATSTTGVIASFLTTPNADGKQKYSVKEIREMLWGNNSNKGILQNVFSHDNRYSYFKHWYYGFKYTEDALTPLLNEIGSEHKLSDTVIPLNIVATSTSDLEIVSLSTFAANKDSRKDYKISDITKVTLAKPGYFKEAELMDGSSKKYYIDGSSTAPNVIFKVLQDIKTYYKNIDYKDINVVFVGVGRLKFNSKIETKKWDLNKIKSFITDNEADEWMYNFQLTCSELKQLKILGSVSCLLQIDNIVDPEFDRCKKKDFDKIVEGIKTFIQNIEDNSPRDEIGELITFLENKNATEVHLDKLTQELDDLLNLLNITQIKEMVSDQV